MAMEESCYTTHQVVHGSSWRVSNHHGNSSHSPHNRSPSYSNNIPSLGFSWLTFSHSYGGHKSLDELFPLSSWLLPSSSNEGVYHRRTFYRVVLHIGCILLPSSYWNDVLSCQHNPDMPPFQELHDVIVPRNCQDQCPKILLYAMYDIMLYVIKLFLLLFKIMVT